MTDLQPIVDVVAVRVLSRYILELTFAGGEVKVIDLEPLLWGEAFAPLRSDYDLFQAVTVDADAGTIVWPNGADISPRTLYVESRPAVPHAAHA
jgi:hypothetical protein